MCRLVIAGVLASALCAGLQAQVAPGKKAAAAAPVNDAKSIAPRVAPTDYLSHAQVGNFTLAAEFTGHAVPTPEATFNMEDCVAVELAFYGPPDAKLLLSFNDFSLRINGKKTPAPAQAFELIYKSLKDPEWEPPEPVEKQSATSIGSSSGGGRGGAQDSGPPVVPKMPFPLQRVMEQRVQKASFPEGERVLPQAGLIYFRYGGNAKSIRSVELIYSGPAGKATMPLQP
jgi:hypothetical protein